MITHVMLILYCQDHEASLYENETDMIWGHEAEFRYYEANA